MKQVRNLNNMMGLTILNIHWKALTGRVVIFFTNDTYAVLQSNNIMQNNCDENGKDI